MIFKNSLKITKLKLILTITLGYIWYTGLNYLMSFCSLDTTYYKKFALFSSCVISPQYIDKSFNLSNTLFDYSLVFIPIILFYTIYSFIQYKVSK